MANETATCIQSNNPATLRFVPLGMASNRNDGGSVLEIQEDTCETTSRRTVLQYTIDDTVFNSLTRSS